MAHVSLYRRFRPATWDKVIGQDHIVLTLVNQIKSGTVGHAYLFTGTRGTGKTSSAKIFAKAVNCLDPKNGSPCGVCSHCRALADPSNLDIVEMDAASNNGVDEIRELKENVQYPPTSARYKVYIIDEVHMLSGSAFNALLKTLEEPPAHAIFILATTEVHKVPQTILSRCLRFDFRLVSKEKLVGLLKQIFAEIGYSYEEEALEILALHGEGSVRDTLSIADICLSYSPEKLTAEAVLEMLGASDFQTLFEIASGILSGQIGEALKIADGVYARGKGISTFNKDLCAFFRDILAVKNVSDYKSRYNAQQTEALKKLADRYDNYRLGRVMDILSSAENLIRYSTQPQIIMDACIVKASELQTEPNIEALLSRVRALENKLADLQSGAIKITYPDEPSPQISVSQATDNGDPYPLPSDGAPSSGMEDILSKLVPAEEEAVFCDDTQEDAPSGPDELAKGIMGGLLTVLREQNYSMLYHALSKQEDYGMNGNTLAVRVSDAASWSLINAPGNPALLKSFIRQQSGGDYDLEITRKSSREEIRTGSKNTLIELFGNKLKSP